MANGLVVAPKTFVLDLIDQYCKCQGCARKLKKINKLLEKIHGIQSTSVDSNAGRVTISGFVDPQEVIRVLRKNNIKADVLLEEIIPSMDNHMMQIATLPRPVDQESHKQNLVAQVQQFVENSGLKELELTLNLKATFNGKNKDEMTTMLESDHTHKKIVMDDDHDHCPKSQGHCCGRHGGGAHVCHGGAPNCSPCGQVHNPYNSYGGNYGTPVESNSWSPAPCGGPPIDQETPWQRDYFPPPAPVAGYEPSAPPWYGNHDESPSSCIASPMAFFLLVVVIYLLLFR
ncbi:hypothetical protein RHGRI_033097 [Rhododendron griersonianum]|uniref:HMA domain-containing protein n=1 Tax=Rhododendron griersonianum TaxID=479676 RepID=A0AAV6I101_9ERIC|nr:hypothetical protein RHGRI_033097 [Rhododendron griersonianum]